MKAQLPKLRDPAEQAERDKAFLERFITRYGANIATIPAVRIGNNLTGALQLAFGGDRTNVTTEQRVEYILQQAAQGRNMNTYTTIGSFLIGLISGFIGAVAGGGGLISIPFLILIGMPPQVSLATSKFGGLGMSTGAIYKYVKGKKVVWQYVIGLCLVGIAASLLGAKMLLSIDQKYLNTVIGTLLILLVPTLFLNSDFGTKRIDKSPKMKYLGYFLYFLASILASFMGGVGTVMMIIVIYFFGLPFIEGNATELMSYTALSISAVIIFMAKDIINYQAGIVLFLGMIAGGYIGAHTAIKKGDRWVKFIYSAVIILSAIKVLFS